MPETILIVDDEESVRRTFHEWLIGANLGCKVLVAAEAEAALRHAQREPIDLAILDWNLGTGMDGLRLLEDLVVFRPDVVAILVTGYAAQATPLMAMRMGVRDYLDKNHELTRETFIAAVRKQLVRIIPAKRERELHAAQAAFRSAVEQVLPLVRSTAALADAAPLPRAAAALCSFLREATHASDAVLLVHHGDASHAYAGDGSRLEMSLAPFSKTIAAGAASMGEPSVSASLDASALKGTQLQPFEKGRKSVLAAPLAVGGGVVAVLELFDKPAPGFTTEDRRLAAAAANVGTEMLKQALTDRQTQKTLLDAVDAALKATDNAAPTGAAHLSESVLDAMRTSLERPNAAIGGKDVLALAEAIQTLAAKFGDPAVRHCLALVRQLASTLDEVAGT
jgi:CheY-like chemotaxis protein